MKRSKDSLDNDPVFMMERARRIAFDHGDALTAWHKNWVIDQMIRELTGDAYDKWVKHYNATHDLAWDIGIKPKA